MKTADFIDYLVEDEATKVICLFLEEIGDPDRFAAAAEKADRAGKPIVALKVGSSPAGQQAALAHTGSVAGDDAVVRRGVAPAQHHPGRPARGTADHRRRCSATAGGRAGGGWAC